MSEAKDADESIVIQQLNHTLRDLLLLWFSVGFLHVERITWESACDILQKVIMYMISIYFISLQLHLFPISIFLIDFSPILSSLLKVSDYEAIHPIRNWLDLKRRVGPYRRCYIFMHPSMPREPIVVLHTALCDVIPGNKICF